MVSVDTIVQSIGVDTSGLIVRVLEEHMMYLDTTQCGAGPAASSGSSTEMADNARRHILVIDDDPANRELIADDLGQNGYLRVSAFVGKTKTGHLAYAHSFPRTALLGKSPFQP